MVPPKENHQFMEKNIEIPYPNQIDRESSKDANQYQKIDELKDIIDNHIINIEKYKKGDVCELVYSEEEFKEENKFISYDKLIELINVKDTYNKNNYKNFKYQNYNNNCELLFSSKFESGNLKNAIKINSHEYDLILRPETDCSRTYHWFFFRVQINDLCKSGELDNNKVVKFNIINLYKKTVLFNEKIRILSYYNNGWTRDTFNVHYFINGIDNNNINSSNIYEINIMESNTNDVNSNVNNHNQDKNNMPPTTDEGWKYHTLTFSFDFSKILTTNKYIYFSYCYPYSYSQLDLYLSSLNNYKDILRFDEIGKSLEGNSLHMLIITNFNDSFDELANKKAIIFTSRVHPGESNGSYVIHGVIEFLLSNDPAAKNLRKNFIFKIVPMLNPDGVVRGNFRMNFLGKDLNRMWDEPSETICPTIFNTVKMIKKTLDSRDIYFFCDFHGHSNKHNFFLYSCKSKYEYLQLDENTIIPNPQKFKLTFYELVFQFILNKENIFLDRFSCTNKIIPSKTKTSRAILKTKYNVDFSYCLESSIAAMKTKEGNLIPYTINLYKKIGKDFCISLNKLIEPKIFFSVLSTIRFSKNEKCSLYSKSKAKGKLLVLPMINNINNGTTTGSPNIQNNSNSNYSANASSNNNNNNKNSKPNNNSNNNQYSNIKQSTNGTFHKLSEKSVNSNFSSKFVNSNKNKNFGLTNSTNIKESNNMKYNNKLKRSYEIMKHS